MGGCMDSNNSSRRRCGGDSHPKLAGPGLPRIADDQQSPPRLWGCGRNPAMNRNHIGFFAALLGLAWQAQGTDINHSPFSHPRKAPNTVAARALAVVPQVYTTSHFAIVYTTSGVDAIAQGGLGLDGQGVPKAVDSLGVLAEQVWRLAIDTLGDPAPLATDSAFVFGVKVPTGKFSI